MKLTVGCLSYVIFHWALCCCFHTCASAPQGEDIKYTLRSITERYFTVIYSIYTQNFENVSWLPITAAKRPAPLRSIRMFSLILPFCIQPGPEQVRLNRRRRSPQCLQLLALLRGVLLQTHMQRVLPITTEQASQPITADWAFKEGRLKATQDRNIIINRVFLIKA